MITFMDSKDNVKGSEKCLDSLLWHACAGSMVKMPPVNSRVYYFPQGHAEHASSAVDFSPCGGRIPPYILCRVASMKFMADPETDEVFAKIRLVPIAAQGEPDFADESLEMRESQEKPASFAKTLTQSDANNGGGFSVPRYCAETIFPRLDYSADPPVQTILAKDVHGEVWKFRHIYRGTPRRHLLTTGWSTFVNNKKLVAGDSIVFLRAENGDLCVGIRRAKRGGIAGGYERSGWTRPDTCFNGLSAFLDEGKMMRCVNGYRTNATGKLRPESVVEAAKLASDGQAFEVVYYPRGSTPEFCVKASVVKASMQIRWCSGIRFKMAFETEDSSRISWFMGMISSVQVADPLCWPDSPWRLLQVTWDEPELLQNVNRVSPWLVELVSNMPAIHLSPFSQPRKKPRLPHHHPDFPFDPSQIPSFPGTLMDHTGPFGCAPENTPAGMQGARHAHFGVSFSDLHLNKFHSGTITPSRASVTSPAVIRNPSINDDVSCLLTMAYNNSSQSLKNSDDAKTAQLVLFGRTIVTEPQISLSCFGNTVSQVCTGNSSPDEKTANFSDGERSKHKGLKWLKDNHTETDPNLEIGHCKVFMESEDVGRTLNLLSLGSYDELYKKLADMFSIENHDTLNNVHYRDVSGTVRTIGDETFSDFTKSARRLTILTDSSSDSVGRT